MAKAKTARAKPKFSRSVQMTAQLNLSEAYASVGGSDDAGTSVKRIYTDGDWLVAEAHCGDTADVCLIKDIPELIAFLQSIVDAK